MSNDWTSMDAAEIQDRIYQLYQEIGTTPLRRTVEIIVHPDHVAELRALCSDASGPSPDAITLTENDAMPRGTMAERLSDGSWRFTPIVEKGS